MIMKGDFHIHSNNSDGKFSVKELIDKYSEKEYDFIAITDHDNVDGCEEAINYGRMKGIKVIPGIELSTKLDGEDIHLLGYFNNDDFKKSEIIEYSKKRQLQRINRCKAMEESLRKYFNIEINSDLILAQTEGMIGRPHIAKAIVEGGYAKDNKEAFEKYIGDDSPAYISSSYLTVEDGFEILKRNNALIVLAHPVLIKKNNIEYLLDTFDFAGMEAIYGMNTEEDTKKFINICNKRNLLITAGSDFHDFGTYNHSNIGDITLDNFNIQKLIKAIQNK